MGFGAGDLRTTASVSRSRDGRLEALTFARQPKESMKNNSASAIGRGRFASALRAALVFGAISLCSTVQAALLGFYPFDGADPKQDASGQSKTLESAGADPSKVSGAGVEGDAAGFNGAQRWIAPLDINPDTYPQFTMGAWVKTVNLAPGLRKVLGSDDGGWDRTIGLDDRNGPFRYGAFTGSGISLGTPGPVSTNNWTFFAATYDRDTAEMTVYVDLDSTTQEPLNGAVTSDANFGPGATTVSIGSVGPAGNGEGWEGLIDNVFFYDEVLSADRLTAIRNGGRAAILGQPADDPNLVVTSTPDLTKLAKVPNVKTLSYGIKNSGATKALNISRVTIAGPDAGYFTVANAPTSVAAGGTGKIDVQFDSKGQVGSFAATAVVESNDPSNPSLVLDLNSVVVASQTLLGLYSFDDPANPLKDDSGAGKTLRNGNDTGTASPTYSATGGFNGGGFSFDGGDWLVAPININPTAVPHLAMGAWVKTASLEDGLRKVMGHDDGAWDRAIGLDIRAVAAGGDLPEPTLRYAAFTGTTDHGPTQGNPPPTPTSTEAWTFLGVDYDQEKSQVSLYVDLDASTTDDPLQVVTSEAPMGVGATSVGIGTLSPNGGEFWVGSIDNVFFVGGGLDAATMKNVRDTGKNALLAFGPDPAIAVPAEVNFGELPNRSPKTLQLVVKNGGATQPLQIASTRITGRDAAAFTLGTVPSTIAPGATVEIPLTVTPGNREGLLQATVELISNNTSGRLSTIGTSAGVPFASLRSALLGFYSFDDANNPLKDDSGNGNDLVQPPDDAPTHDATGGLQGGGYLFNGNQHLIAPININPSAQPTLTMGAWVRTDSLDPGLRKVIGSDDGGWDRTIGLDNREPNTLPLRYTSFSGTGTPIEGTPEPVNTEDWTFLAATYDQPNALVTVWVDLNAKTTNDALVAVSRPNSTFGPGFSTTAIGNIRPDNLAEGWLGSIDNVFFFNTVLSQSDLTKLRNQGKAAIEEGPIQDTIQISSVQKTGAGVVLTYSSRTGVTYTIQYAEKLGDPWTAIGTQPGQASSTTFTDSDAARLARKTGFYRVATP